MNLWKHSRMTSLPLSSRIASSYSVLRMPCRHDPNMIVCINAVKRFLGWSGT
jgi:hypothetical protein